MGINGRKMCTDFILIVCCFVKINRRVQRRPKAKTSTEKATTVVKDPGFLRLAWDSEQTRRPNFLVCLRHSHLLLEKKK